MIQLLGFYLICAAIVVSITLLCLDLTLKEKLIFMGITMLVLAMFIIGVYLLVGGE